MSDEQNINLDEEGKGVNNIPAENDFVVEEEESGADSLKKLREKLKNCEKKNEENLLGWQRSRADYANALKRFKEEKEEAISLGVSMSLLSLLPALDSLNRAKEAGEIPDNFKGIEKQILSAFENLGAVEIRPKVGDIFDPKEHEALGEDVVDEASKDNTITAMLDCGWKMKDKVLRASRVRVGHKK
jgi:molecular chaperone GrpE